MITLKKQITYYMYFVTNILIVVILIILLCIQIVTEQKRAYNDATRTIQQIESLLAENQEDALITEEEYRQTCIHNADLVARIIEKDPDILNDAEELNQLAISLEVDEIHIFDNTGRIFSGSHPQYFGYTFDSGEQISFFKPMLEDKTLQLVQDITPNTAESKPMQYSAIWSSNGEYIIQVGMEPANVLKATEKNELSHVFAHFRVNPDADYYAIDIDSNIIIGSTNLDTVGLPADQIGIDMTQIRKKPNGFHTTINMLWSFCVFEQSGTNYLGRAIPAKSLYQRVPNTVLGISFSFILLAIALAKAIILYMDKFVIKKIDELNQKMNSVANGNSEEVFDIGGSVEFAKLNDYINLMIKSLLDSNQKMSYALSKTNVHIGIYEYGQHMKKVQYTEFLPIIFDLNQIKMDYFAKNPIEFQAFLEDVKKDPFNIEEEIYRYKDRYIQLEEIDNDNEIFGVVMDVTRQTIKRMKIEQERDIDSLTGLYNRRGLDTRLAQLFIKPEKLGHSAIFMIDGDGLKGINDTYGHELGDIYLKKIGEAIATVGTKYNVASRQGGDEFVLLLYGYDDEKQLMDAIQTVESIRDNTMVKLNKDIQIPLRFSLGYCLVKNNNDYQTLLKKADEKMYEDKLTRKKQ